MMGAAGVSHEFAACQVILANPPFVPNPDGAATAAGRAEKRNRNPDGNRLALYMTCSSAVRKLSHIMAAS